MLNLILSLLLLVNVASAQELTAARAYDDYIFTLQRYEDAHQDYVVAKNAYLQNKTLNLQNQAQEKTALMLGARDEVVKAHLTAIRAVLVEERGLSTEEKAPFLSGIDEEVAWWAADHSAEEAASRYETNTEYIIYRSLFWISVSKTRYVLGSERNLLVDLRNKVSEIAATGDKNTQAIEKWFNDIEDRFNQSEEAEKLAIDSIADLEKRYGNRQSIYNKAVSLEKEAFLPLVEAKDFFKEIIRVIKTKD
ncbi:hypothetical protein A2630_03835 [Candidatus Woesebacteria bacterium RIFCSPHIGHO2_01_FULL_44_10]|uniref:DUF5667 domain-containing protein n=1 Tax=Candidatus Woesebacteria bacterium RIFCSPLOWO2_01_FULL_44_14 TaxID=1802525 RepID=A0A1F8C4R2_9BACT|nr:MAG: hypothetical protein A2630_03835 [Candidatus Woesebacteria bacterium RIFCSPHIGHO2_01_FULL_44_10]OGM55616.1 MAG: hypothetical protein A3F62_02285 [Candidatus Woesebacteria bacterium RIFCSPHIGHO2_12_FULL_44_11]OGM70889.1 MAG: hypothetical protein A2975_01275 [Candidatus Woesebacteria bacterium RIFCSPLOWO2_01_FULL_44_14]